MTNYSYAQLEALWIQAGGSAALAPTMAAIALAESSGNPNTTGPVGEEGLWQIYPKVWGSLATYDPLANAQGAVHIESVQGLGAWTTYSSGAYQRYLQGGVAPNSSGVPTSTSTGGGTGTGSLAAAAPAPSVPQSGQTVATGSGSTCAWALGNTNQKILIWSVNFSICVVSKTELRALIGALMLGAGAVVTMVGTALILQYALDKTGASKAVSSVMPGKFKVG